MIPNEKLAGGMIKNDTLVVDVVGLDVSVWLPPEADAERAIAALADETGQEVTVAEARPVGDAAGGRLRTPSRRPTGAPREAALRRAMPRALRKEGLLSGAGYELDLAVRP